MGFIWRESVYKNRFKCVCGNQLAGPDTGLPKESVWYDTEYEIFYCNECGRAVCYIREMEVDEDTIPGLHGNIDDFLDKEGQK